MRKQPLTLKVKRFGEWLYDENHTTLQNLMGRAQAAHQEKPFAQTGMFIPETPGEEPADYDVNGF